MKNNCIDMVWRYKYYVGIIEACDRVINDNKNFSPARELFIYKRRLAFQQLLDFQVAFHSKD